MQGIGEVHPRSVMRERQFSRCAILQLHPRHGKHGLQGGAALPGREAVEAAYHPLQFQQHGRGHEQHFAGLDQPARGLALPLRLGIAGVLDQVTREDIGVEADHLPTRRSTEAGSKSAGTALRRLRSSP